MTKITIGTLLMQKEDAAQKERLQAAQAEHDQRKARINQLMEDNSECFEAEIDVIERCRAQQHAHESDRHAAASARIDADCDQLREDVVNRHLAKLEADPVSPVAEPIAHTTGAVSDLLENISVVKEAA